MNDFVLIIVVHQVFFQGMFFAKNLVLRRRLGIAIKGGNREANVSIGYFTIFISVSIFLALFDPPASSVKRLVPTTAVACCLLILNLLIAVISLLSLGDSRRVGVLDDQRTALVDMGIYRHSRNPYFLSYLLMFTAYTVLLQSVSLLVLSLVGVAISACREVVMKVGRPFARFNAEIVSSRGGKVRAKSQKAGGGYTDVYEFHPDQSARLRISGQNVRWWDVTSGQQLDIFLPPDRIEVATQSDEGGHFADTSVTITTVTVIRSEELPTTASIVPLLGALGSLFVAVGAGLNLTRRKIRKA